MTQQLTVRGVDKKLHQMLQQEAQKQGMSINKYVLYILRERHNLQEKEKPRYELHHDLDHLAGTWDENDQKEFEHELKTQREIDGDLW